MRAYIKNEASSYLRKLFMMIRQTHIFFFFFLWIKLIISILLDHNFGTSWGQRKDHVIHQVFKKINYYFFKSVIEPRFETFVQCLKNLLKLLIRPGILPCYTFIHSLNGQNLQYYVLLIRSNFLFKKLWLRSFIVQLVFSILNWYI